MMDPNQLARVLPDLKASQLLVLPAAPAIAPGGTSQPSSLRIPEDGILIHLRPSLRLPTGSTADQYRQAAAQLAIGIRVGEEEFFTDGRSGQLVSAQTFLELPEGFTFFRVVQANQTLTIRYVNRDTGLTITPEAFVGWIPSRALFQQVQYLEERMAAPRASVDARGRY